MSFPSFLKVFQDVHVMIFVGFGFLMTFLPRFGYSAVCFTMIITVCCVEWGILVNGLLNMDHETMTIHITWLRCDKLNFF